MWQADEEGEAAFRATAGKLMGDLGTSGDAPFGGEVSVQDPQDAQVWGGGGGAVGGSGSWRGGGCCGRDCRWEILPCCVVAWSMCTCAVLVCPSSKKTPYCRTAVPLQVYWWHEKYRPRRPKYFNRVHTG